MSGPEGEPDTLDRPDGRPMPFLTRVLAVLALLALAAAVVAVVHWSGGSRRASEPPRVPAAPATADPVAGDPCSWLAPADFAAVGVTTAPLVNYLPSMGLQPGEVDCVGTGEVAIDLRWSLVASTAHIDITTWVGQLRAGKWSVNPVKVPGTAEADYLDGALDPAGQPVARAEILVRVGTLRIALTVPPATINAQAALVSLATLIVERITGLDVTEAPPLPSAPPSASAGG